MKRIFIFGIVALLAVGSLFAKEDVLIDFSLLAADSAAEDENSTPQKGVPAQNAATTIDTSSHAASNYTDEQKAVMTTSLAIENWQVWLSNSSASVGNAKLSYTKESTSAKYGTVMGVRAHFPTGSWNANVTVKPPFEVPAYEPKDDAEEGDKSSKFEGGYGVIKNVGILKSVAVDVYGEYFPYTLYVILLNDKGEEIPINMGSLNFYGWGELRWDNPRYVQDVRNRALNQAPLYPQSLPFLKFAGFRIFRDASQPGGDFVTYFKDVKIIYDEALLDEERDIDDESIWNIVSDREAGNNKSNMNKLADQLYLESLDGRKQASEVEFTPSGGGSEEQEE
ncbi:MAG: flagellar filament outer layer protein FlaA [Treponema sp.]|jgi:hypothetical protein|nr:flagellar filament outer layer protein FlaA [Treponema sp.]